MEKYFDKSGAIQERYCLEIRERWSNFLWVWWLGRSRSLADVVGVDEPSLSHSFVKLSEFFTQEAKWDTPCLNSTLNNHPVVQEILGIPIFIHKIKESYWRLNSFGDFSTIWATWATLGFQWQNESNWPLVGFRKMIQCPKLRFSFGSYTITVFHRGHPYKERNHNWLNLSLMSRWYRICWTSF